MGSQRSSRSRTGSSRCIRPYYDFVDVDVDRYEIDGRMRQVLVSAREMNSMSS